MARIATYVICTSPRSGSTLLCELLRATGVAGNPESWFHRPSLDAWAEALGDPPRGDDEAARVGRLFDAAKELGTGSSEVFGLRLQRDSFDFFFDTLRRLHGPDGSDRERFERSFGPTSFIYLTRADKVEQAVSVVRALQTGLWHVAADGSEMERSAPHRDPYYDEAAIRAEFDGFVEADRLWQEWFTQQGIEPIRISYTELVADYAGVTRQLLARLGLDPSRADGITPGVRKLADATSRDWVLRFNSAGRR